jgi:hypothetical protein
MADVRHDTVPACTQVLRALTVRGKAWGLCGTALVALDGRQWKAVTSTRRQLTTAQRHETRPAVDATRAHDRPDLDATAAVAAEGPPPTGATRRARLRQRRARQGRDAPRRDRREARGERQGSRSAPDRRARPQRPHGAVGDQVPTAVEAQPTRMVAPHVPTAGTDVEQPSALAWLAQEARGGAPLQVVAAMGDDPGEARNAWAEAGREPDMATPLPAANRP